jgi:hypothetical protein
MYADGAVSNKRGRVAEVVSGVQLVGNTVLASRYMHCLQITHYAAVTSLKSEYDLALQMFLRQPTCWAHFHL